MMLFWYILFIRTGLENKVELFLKKTLDMNKFQPFIPISETLFRINGMVKKETKPLFPGYIFIASEVSSMGFINNTRNLIYDSKDIFNIVRYGCTNDISMREQEKNRLLSLYNDDFCIGPSYGIVIGDKVQIRKGPLRGYESIIKKIDRHKRKAIITLDFMGEKRQCIVSLEITEKI